MNRKILIDLLDDFAFGSHDIEQTADRITELYKQDQNLQLQQTGVSGSYFAVCYSTNEGLFFVDEEDNQTKSQGNAKKFKSVKEAEMYINKELCGFGNVIPL